MFKAVPITIDKPKKKRNYPESTLSIQFFKWLFYTHKRAYEVGYHISNEGKRSLFSRAKAQGIKKGMLDIHIPIANKNHIGLFIELKIKPNKPTKEQLDMMIKLTKEGHECHVCYTLEDAIEVTDLYMRTALAKREI